MDHKITDFDPDRPFRVRQWRRLRARGEFARYVDRRLPFGGPDAYKESPRPRGGLHRPGNPLLFAVERAREAGWGQALSQKKASLRRKYSLPETADLPPRHSATRLQAPYTGMFT